MPMFYKTIIQARLLSFSYTVKEQRDSKMFRASLLSLTHLEGEGVRMKSSAPVYEHRYVIVFVFWFP